MNSIPAVAFSAWSGSGKTTLIEQLVREKAAARASPMTLTVL